MAITSACPFLMCAGTQTNLRAMMFHGRYAVACFHCGGRGPVADTEAEAVEKWNARAEPDTELLKSALRAIIKLLTATCDKCIDADCGGDAVTCPCNGECHDKKWEILEEVQETAKAIQRELKSDFEYTCPDCEWEFDECETKDPDEDGYIECPTCGHYILANDEGERD